MRNSRYGDLQGGFVGTGWELFKATLIIWLIAILLFGLIVGLSAYAVINNGPPTTAHPFSAPSAAAGLGSVALILAMLFVWPVYQAIEWRWWLDGVRFGDVTFASAFPRAKILTLYLRYFAYVIAASIVIGIVIFAAAMGLRGIMTPDLASSMRFVWIALAILGYLLVLLGLGIVYRYLLQHQLWRAIVDTTKIRDLASSTSAIGEGAPANALGEGLLDGLDMAGF